MEGNEARVYYNSSIYQKLLQSFRCHIEPQLAFEPPYPQYSFY
ncbi:hypothetical protein [Acinetobacter pragensis]|nr:hypothetical protein [Acinetobacter pragensis]